MESKDNNKAKSKNLFMFIYSILQFLGWTYILYEILKYTFNYHDARSLNKALLALRIVQSLQIFDVIFAFLNMTKANKFASFIQVVSRIINTFWLYHDTTPRTIILLTLYPWSISDMIRSLYYLLKDYYFIQFLRYNLFLILYPLGVTGEILAMEYFRTSHSEWTIYLRLLQASFVLGLFYLYAYLLKQRSQFYKKAILKKN